MITGWPKKGTCSSIENVEFECENTNYKVPFFLGHTVFYENNYFPHVEVNIDQDTFLSDFLTFSMHFLYKSTET